MIVGAMKEAFVSALKVSAALLLGVGLLGVGYGIYMRSEGFDAWYPVLMGATIFAGSMEFITVGLLQEEFSPIYAFLLTLLVNGRHSFYSIAIYERYVGMGWKRYFLVSMLIDESFAVNYTTNVAKPVRQDWFMLFVTLLLYASWIVGAMVGAQFGGLSVFDVKGLDFVMTALFIVIFVNSWQGEATHGGSLLGLVVSIAMLALCGPTYFLLPTLIVCTVIFSLRWRRIGRVKRLEV